MFYNAVIDKWDQYNFKKLYGPYSALLKTLANSTPYSRVLHLSGRHAGPQNLLSKELSNPVNLKTGTQ